MSHSAQPAIACASCGKPLTGRFCASCGEETLHHDDLTVRHFVSHTLLHETLHLDGKIWRTLRQLFLHPGFLAEEYCAGRRKLYINPLRLLITAILAYALLTRGGLQVSLVIAHVPLSIAPAGLRENDSVQQAVDRIDRFGILHRMLAGRAPEEIASESAREKFHATLEKFAEPLSFANVLLLALALYALFRRKRQLLIEHGVLAMHFVSFVLLSSLIFFLPVLWMIRAGLKAAFAILIVVIIWQFLYLAVAIRRFYFHGTRRVTSRLLAVAAAFGLYLLNAAFVTTIQLIGGALALWTL